MSSRLAKNVEILGAEPVGGGCIHHTVRLATNLQEDFFLKWADGPASDFFVAEADGLRALSGATGFTVPEVIAHSSAGQSPVWLLLEYVPCGTPHPDYGDRLGEALARLHAPTEDPHGWHRSNYIGSLHQTNTLTDDWSDFWWVERLEPQWALAAKSRLLAGLEQEWATLKSRLPGLICAAATDGSSLLHGDLWSGNVYPGPDGGPVLVDPAVYRGHREVDLAMTELFGGFPTTFYAAYQRHLPLAQGYHDVRRHVYQLYPLLVHVNLFGGAYVDGVARALRKALRG